jgi:hypothetical protein
MQLRAAGAFEVTVNQEPPFDATDGIPMARATVDKRFTGDLTGTGKVHMLGAGSPASGTAGYVALERVVGELAGRAGSFILMHNGTMRPGQQSLVVTVVPGSGARGLAGIAGQMSIDIVDGKHSYTFDFTLGEG